MGQTGGGRASGAQSGMGAGRSSRRRQQAGFSVFLDQVVDEEGNARWETRLYHNETGAETTLAGAAPEEWIAWILERTGTIDAPGASVEASTSHAVVEIASVEILNMSVEADEPVSSESIHTVRAQLIVQLTGIARLEREIGSRVLGEIVRPNRATPEH